MSAKDRTALWAFLAFFTVLTAGKLALVFGHHRPAPRAAYVRPFGGDGYPVVLGFVDSVGKAESRLQVGDTIIALGGRDMKGTGQLRFLTATAGAAWEAPGDVPVDIARGNRRMTIGETRGETVRPDFWTGIVVSLVSTAVAALVFVRAKRTPSSRRIAGGLAVMALLHTLRWDSTEAVVGPLLAIAFPIAVAWPVMTLAGSVSFPEEAASWRGVNRWWPWFFMPLGVFLFAAVNGWPMDPVRGTAIDAPATALWMIASVVMLTLNYRRSGPVGRRQIKWVLYASYVGAVLVAVVFTFDGFAAALDQPAPMWARVAYTLATVSYPVGMFIAMLRYDLFDIDRIVGATLGYNVLGVFVVGGGFLVVPPLTSTLASTLDVNPSVSRTALTLALAMLIIFAERRLRPLVDRLFFKERFALEQAMKVLPERFASVRKPDDLWALTGTELTANLRPASCVIFISAGATFVPVFNEGDALPAAMNSDGDLVRWIGALTGAVKIDAKSARATGTTGAALLSGLATNVVFPIHRGASLEAFVCLGEKRSGDVYTHTDLTLLTSLGKTISSHMLRFDEAELLEKAQAMQQRMRRYVPGAIAAAIAEGANLESGEREVSVLFVDIRGYTAYADGRAVTDIFSTVNRYTEAVSTIVTEGGGVVVEFNGDGMMAVFGAPRPLAEKERAAIETARRLVDAVPRLGAATPGGSALTVGVGVATGPAFVGNIEAVDRVIWSAIGSTTNLAARLQSLTRERNASVLVDEATHTRAGVAGDGFVRHPDVAIRGRKESVTIYAFGAQPAPQSGAVPAPIGPTATPLPA